MAYFLIAFVALGVVLGLTSTEQLMVQRSHNAALIQPGSLDGTQFARFAFAAEQYVEQNPSAGTIPVSAIPGNFTASFLSNVSAWVSAPGSNPRTLICSGTLGPAALQSALQYSQGDAAFGTPTAAGHSWISNTGLSGLTVLPLANPVPTSSTLVFVVSLSP